MTVARQPFFQMAWIVRDLHAAMSHWHLQTGTGPFFYLENLSMDYEFWDGKSHNVSISAAFAYRGSMQIELIQQHSDSPTAYRESFPAGTEGFHHLAVAPDSYDDEVAAYQAQGARLCHQGIYLGQRFCYVDTRKQLGCMVEIAELSADMRAFFATMEQAARDWDGSEPYRAVTLG